MQLNIINLILQWTKQNIYTKNKNSCIKFAVWSRVPTFSIDDYWFFTREIDLLKQHNQKKSNKEYKIKKRSI